MTKKIGLAIFSLGAVLLILASLLLIRNNSENEKAGQNAESCLEEVKTIIAENKSKNEEETEISDGMYKESMAEGYNYIGYLTIPKLKLILPVMDEWDEERLKISPCRHFGSLETGDLVIAAHNYKRHFGYLSSLIPGDEITFTDMEGKIHTYRVAKSEKVDPTEVTRVKDSGCPLVLYTCNLDWSKRIAVFCEEKV